MIADEILQAYKQGESHFINYKTVYLRADLYDSLMTELEVYVSETSPAYIFGMQIKPVNDVDYRFMLED